MEVRKMKKNSADRHRLLARGLPTCRHFLDKSVDIPKLCLWPYECARCAFDQWLDETAGANGVATPTGSRQGRRAAA
jgi:hypothetical protein